MTDLSGALAKITKLPAFFSGVLSDATRLIATEGCRALDTHRVGIWKISDDLTYLRGLGCYNLIDDQFSMQENFSLDAYSEYIALLKSERLIVINDAHEPNPLSDVLTDYDPNICAMLDAPIRVEGKLVGVVCIEQDRSKKHPQFRKWTTEEQNFASSLADFVSISIVSADRRSLTTRLETMMNNLPGMVYRCLNNPPDFTFTFVSNGSMALCGYTPEELISNNAVAFFDMVHPEDVDMLAARNAETLSIGLPLEVTFRIIMKDGTVKWIWERSHIVEFNADGAALVLEGFYTDITEQRRLESAELANRAKTNFLANMSHEIRTPMNAILGLTNLALRTSNNPETTEHITNIKRAGKQLLSIINDILDFSKIEAGAISLLPEKYNVNAMIDDIASMIYINMANKPITLIINDDPNLPYEMIGDVTRVKQIIINVLNNAVKFTEKGHVIFTMSADVIENDMYTLKVTVQDTGIGIHKEDIPSLFDNFTQVNTRRNRTIEGTGLGLAITKKLIHLMGGEIFVESKYGVGSRFSFYILQKVVRLKPLRLSENKNNLCIAILFSDQEKSNALAFKLEKMGVAYDIIETPWVSVKTYSHVFFDAEKSDILQNLDLKNTKRIQTSRGTSQIDADICTYKPLTNNTIAKLFDIDTGTLDDMDNEGQGLNISDVHILVVDDIDINLLISEALLTAIGGNVDTARSGAEAIEFAKNNDYDIIFMDHMMPEMDGIDATKAIRNLPNNKYSNVPIVALTANVVGDIRDMMLQNGLNDFLPKPLEYSEIERVLKQWLPRDKWISTA